MEHVEDSKHRRRTATCWSFSPATGGRIFASNSSPRRSCQAESFIGAIHKIANRITVGVVIAALLIASSLIMLVPSPFTLLGYPGLAVVGYVIAAVAAVYLIASTLMHDRRDREQATLKGK